MKNFVQKGDVLTIEAAGAVSSGDIVTAGSIFGVAAYDAATGDDVEVAVTGVFTLPKAAESISAGAALYYDDAAGNLTATSEDNILVGVAVQDAGMSATTVTIRLNGVFGIPVIDATA